MTDDPYAPPPQGFDLLIAAIVRNPEDPPTPIRICGVEYVRPGNRWAAFTDDELEALSYLLGRTVRIGELGLQRASLLGDVQRELARRKATP